MQGKQVSHLQQQVAEKATKEEMEHQFEASNAKLEELQCLLDETVRNNNKALEVQP